MVGLVVVRHLLEQAPKSVLLAQPASRGMQDS
jgi:hypothetical protein